MNALVISDSNKNSNRELVSNFIHKNIIDSHKYLKQRLQIDPTSGLIYELETQKVILPAQLISYHEDYKKRNFFNMYDAFKGGLVQNMFDFVSSYRNEISIGEYLAVITTPVSKCPDYPNYVVPLGRLRQAICNRGPNRKPDVSAIGQIVKNLQKY